MRIAEVAPLWTAVPPADYGGIELMVHLLVEELIKRGHEVTLFASGDSRTGARLRAVCERNAIEAMARGEAYDYDYYASAALAEVLRDAHSYDVIHCHVGASKIPLSVATRIPMVHTLHTALTPDDQWVLGRYAGVPVVAVSQSQIASLPPDVRRRIRVIHNACDFDAYDLAEAPGQYLAFLGRMGRHKNPLDAIRVAKVVGLPIVLAGRPQAGEEEVYFAKEIEPLIDGRTVRYIGAVNHPQKRELLRNASAFLFPTSWAEPFGVAPVEAMASGLPVLAYNNGSVAEVVDYGVTGFHANSVETLAPLVGRALALDRRAVREHARKRFSHHRMVDEYLEVLRCLVEQRPTTR